MEAPIQHPFTRLFLFVSVKAEYSAGFPPAQKEME